MSHTSERERFLERWSSGDESVPAEVLRFLDDPGNADRDHAAWGALCETIGLVGPAFHEFQQGLADRPHDVSLLKKLASYYAERGDMQRAGELWQRLLARSPADAETVDELARLLLADDAGPELSRILDTAVQHGYPVERARQWRAQLEHAGSPEEPATDLPRRDDPFPEPTDADCVRMAALFAGREDVYARQWCRPDDRRVGYSPVKEPLTPAVLRQHLLGSFTVGVYPIRLDQTATWFAVDLDIQRKSLEAARRDHALAARLRDGMRRTGIALLEALRALGLDPLFENSGYKGRHYWVFLARPIEARVLHHFGRLLLRRLEPLLPPEFSLEFFPKQSKRTGKGLGNLIKLPLGIHQRTGYRSVLLDAQGRPLTDPYAALRNVSRLSRDEFLALADRLKGTAPATSDPREEAERPAEEEPSEEEPSVPLWPPDAPPPWTEADFETDRPVRHLLARCPVLAALKEKVAEHRQLSHDEQVVLIHTMGHLPGGPQAVNYLLHQCIDFAPEMLMKSRHQGNPISCPKIRKRIGHITRTVPCCCDFSFAPNHYPTPVLHLETLPPEPGPSPSPSPGGGDDREAIEHLIRRYTVIVHRREELDAQWRELHDAVCRRLAALPDRSVTTEAGRFYLVTRDGVESLEWERSESERT